ncbi:uncharacterized protein HKW66_Vig0026830 [Vigna angularis]|uniref:RING-type domain-containing protein n=1 Tax=Phaseolus angularis TaxID=3914 RepID=A0A8T0L8K1_PHAAN|nr:uncharacterized protein HKW66_Vig0026830 [Vigna angularis]
MSWRRVLNSAQALAAHTFLLCFTLFLVLKLDHDLSCSWWVVFLPLWMFHGVVARGRFSLPAPSAPHLGYAAVDLKIVFLPLLTFEIIILIDNFRMCKALMPGDEENLSDEAIWETLPWSNPVIHRNSREASSSSSTTIRYLDWNSGLVVSTDENRSEGRICSLQEIGGHFMKVPIIVFQVLLCMHLEGTPASAVYIPLPVIFSPLFLLQGAGVMLSASKLVEKLVLLLRSGAAAGIYFRFSSRVHDCLGFLHHGSRLLGWWSIDEGSREEQARIYHEGASGNTIRTSSVLRSPPMHLAIATSTGKTIEKVLCRICFEGEINVVLLPCRHRVLCSTCSEKCKKCPICRDSIAERLPVYDV